MAKRSPPPPEKVASSATVQSLVTAASVLTALADAHRALALKDVAAASRMPAPKVHRYLASWIEVGLVTQHRATGHYDLGPLALQLGLAAMARQDAVALVCDSLLPLTQLTGASVLASVWGSHGATVVRVHEGPRPLTVAARVGSVLPTLTSATGRAFAAFDSAGTAEIAGDELRAQRSISVSTWQKLLAQVRKQGYATTQGGLVQGLDAAAAPVFDATGRVALVIAAVAPASLLKLERVGTQIAAHGLQLSRTLGWRPLPSPP